MRKILMMASVVMLGASGAWALGTDANTSISNTATLEFSAGGVTQPTVTSTTDTFVVDKKIDLVLTDAENNQQPGAFGQVGVETHYNFKNESNADQNFTFSVNNLGNNEGADYDNDPDSNDVSDLSISCTYTKPDNSSVTKTGSVGASITIEVKEDTNASCTVKATMPDSQHAIDGDIMNITLEAKAVKGDGSDETNTTTSDDQHAVDVVLADGASVTGYGSNGGGKGDTPEDGKDVARHGYIIKSPVLDATKLSCVYSDPIHGQSDHAKRIPGAKLIYVFDINNTGTLEADDVNLTDSHLNTAYFDTSSTATSVNVKKGVVSACVCHDGKQYGENTTGTDVTSSVTSNISGNTLEIDNIDITAQSHTCLSFEVIIK